MPQTKRSFSWSRLAAAAVLSLAALGGMLFCGGLVHHNGVIYRKRAFFFALMMLAAILPAAWRPAENRRWKHSRLLFALTGVVAGGMVFQYLSCAVNETIISLPYLPLMLSLSAVLYAAVWLIVPDSRRAALCFYWLMLILGYGYECVYLFRGITFKPMDIFSAGTALAVAGAYEYPLSARHLFWVQGGVVLWALSGWVRTERSRRRERIVRFACAAAAACWVWLLLSTSLLTRWNVVATAFESDAPYMNRRQGTLTTLMKECQQLKNIRPADYPSEGPEPADERLHAAPALTGGTRPNVIVVMNESLADLTALREIPCTADPLARWDGLTQGAVYGDVLVSAFGGSTCNTEHSFLTSAVPPPGLNAALYSTVRAATPSLAWQLKGCGYSTVAIHPNAASNYQRDRIYPLLGFDRFLSLEDFEGAETVRDLVSDRACCRTILELLETKEAGEPLFVFCITMQNHGGYRTGEVEPRISLAQEDAELEMYLNLTAESDLAMAELAAAVDALQEPTVLLVFGDHQPNLDLTAYPLKAQNAQVKNQLAQYITPFLIRANYPIEPMKLDFVSIHYLAPLLLKTAGLPLTGYDEWLLDVMQRYPAAVLSGYADSDGRFTEWTAGNWPSELTLMNQLRYNRLYDAAHRLPALDFPPTLPKEDDSHVH